MITLLTKVLKIDHMPLHLQSLLPVLHKETLNNPNIWWDNRTLPTREGVSKSQAWKKGSNFATKLQERNLAGRKF